jgi:hypothetical protein
MSDGSSGYLTGFVDVLNAVAGGDRARLTSVGRRRHTPEPLRRTKGLFHQSVSGRPAISAARIRFSITGARLRTHLDQLGWPQRWRACDRRCRARGPVGWPGRCIAPSIRPCWWRWYQPHVRRVGALRLNACRHDRIFKPGRPALLRNADRPRLADQNRLFNTAVSITFDRQEITRNKPCCRCAPL